MKRFLCMFDSVIGPVETVIGVGVIILIRNGLFLSAKVPIPEPTGGKFDVLLDRVSKLSQFDVFDE
jgi:hypothetical protein